MDDNQDTQEIPLRPLVWIGDFQRFSEGKLLIFLRRLDIEITLHLRSRHEPGQSAETVISL
jgi:hypothetical protein